MSPGSPRGRAEEAGKALGSGMGSANLAGPLRSRHAIRLGTWAWDTPPSGFSQMPSSPSIAPSHCGGPCAPARCVGGTMRFRLLNLKSDRKYAGVSSGETRDSGTTSAVESGLGRDGPARAFSVVQVPVARLLVSGPPAPAALPEAPGRSYDHRETGTEGRPAANLF